MKSVSHLQNEKTRSALAKAGSLALAAFIKRPQAELKSAQFHFRSNKPLSQATYSMDY